MDGWMDALICHAVIFSSAELHEKKSTVEWREALEKATSEAKKNPLPLEVFKVTVGNVAKK